MKTKSAWLLAFLVAFMATAWAVPPQPANIQQGMQYNFWNVIAFPPNNWGKLSTYLIDGTEEIDGVEAMKLYAVDSDGNNSKVIAHLYTNASKVYFRHDDQWKLLYDFGLQPGEDMQGVTHDGDMDVKYRCTSIIEHDERYAGWSTMVLNVAIYSDLDNEWQHQCECKWIIGVGSTEDLLSPTWAGMLDNCSTELESLEWNGEQIFKVEIAGTDNIAAEATRSEQVFDLEGRPVKGSRESLAPGVYIVRSGAESRKFVVR